jgi:integrase
MILPRKISLVKSLRDIRKSTGIAADGSKAVAKQRFNFTKKALQALGRPKAGATYFYDSQTRGLAIRVNPLGKKVFVLYRKIKGRPARVTIGDFPDMTLEQARGRASEMNAAIARGENPSEEQRALKAESTLGELFSAYLEWHAKPHKKTWADDDWAFKKYLHRWRLRKLSDISAEDVTLLHARIGSDSGKYAANRVVELLSSMFNRARDWGWKGSNPVARVRPFREKKRERFLQPDELPRLFAALTDEPNELFRDYILVSLLTGARRANVQAMRWDEVDFADASWRIPETKSGEPVTLPLANAVISILEARKADTKSKWVFPGTGKTGHLVEPKRAWAALLTRAGIKDLRLHDLRRTLGSWEASTGASLVVIGKSLGHLDSASTQVYARLNLDPVRAAVGKATEAMMLAAWQRPRALIGQK